ncbi:MAG: hypothetical protein ACKV1O_30985 [Saprospiraceae bacterium]
MTKVAYIHGTPFQDSIPSDEWGQRAALVPRAQYIAYDEMTEGGLKLALLREQLEILSNFYQDNVQYKTALDRVSQALEGNRVSGFYSGGTTPMLDAVNKTITKALQKTQPAVGLVPLENCNRSNSEFAADPRYKDIKSCLFCKPIRERYQDRCENLNYYPTVLNEHLEGSAHHMLYKFVKYPNLEPNVVSTKSVLHATAIDELSKLSGLNRDNMASWYRNGVMRGNTKVGLNPMQPEQTIQNFKDSIQAGVGEPLTIAALTLLISAIASAVGGTIALIQKLRASDQVSFENTVRGAGNPSWGPDKGDFQNGANSGVEEESGGFAGSNLLLPLGLGAAAYLLLK